MNATTFSTLEAAAFVEAVSLPDLIRPQLELLADRLIEEQAVQTALRAREEHQALLTGKLKSLPSRKSVVGDGET
jgi:hypothetical protein